MSTSVDLDSTPDVIRVTSNLGVDTSIVAVGMSTLEFDAAQIRSSLAPPSSVPGIGSLAVVGGAWGNTGRKLGGEVFSKFQKRASTLLSDVSRPIVSALTPDPVAISPVPAPSLFPFPPSLRSPSSLSTSQSQHNSSPNTTSSSFLTPSSIRALHSCVLCTCTWLLPRAKLTCASTSASVDKVSNILVSTKPGTMSMIGVGSCYSFLALASSGGFWKVKIRWTEV